jgi:formylglycine-generating enzyme
MEASNHERGPFRTGALSPALLCLGLLFPGASEAFSDDADEWADLPLDTASIAVPPAVFSDDDAPFDPTATARPASDRPPGPQATPPAKPRGDSKATKTVAKPKARKVSRKGLASPGIVEIPGGCFWMGSPDGVGAANERPRHEVCLGAFRIDRLPVLAAEYEAATGESPWSLCTGASCADPDPNHPAWYVTWHEADSFCRAKGGRLPTEAEFEYAARTGDSSLYLWGDSPADACAHANFADLALSKALPGWVAFPCDDGHALIAPAGGRKPNRWGLHDMAGNVWQWTSDWYAADWYARSPKNDPVGPPGGTGKVMRGGSWMNGPTGGRAAYRDGFDPSDRYSGAIGFRCVYPAP